MVLLAAAVGLLLVALGHSRRGAGVLGGAAWVGAVVRLMMPEGLIGPLGVRSKAFDVSFFTVLALLLTSITVLGY